jgi:hypothetical protein
VLDGAGSFFDADGLVSATHPACAEIAVCDPVVPIAWEVTSIVQAWADGAANHGFLVLPDTTNGGNLVAPDSDDAAHRPRLVIAFGDSDVSVPEPGLLCLLAPGLFAVLLRRK